jgi:hypothetical protein
MLDWLVITAERIPGKNYRWYMNGKLYKQVLAPGGVRKESEKAVTDRLEFAVKRMSTSSKVTMASGTGTSRLRMARSSLTQPRVTATRAMRSRWPRSSTPMPSS